MTLMVLNNYTVTNKFYLHHRDITVGHVMENEIFGFLVPQIGEIDGRILLPTFSANSQPYYLVCWFKIT